jgi:hypothetical protein
VIRLPIELSKNKKGLTIPLSGRLLVLVESAWNKPESSQTNRLDNTPQRTGESG